LALAILICLDERPMHPYEAATTLRRRYKHESVRLNYGSLYSVFASLERRGLIRAADVSREGRLPERTTYELTDDGRVEMHDWLADLVSTPAKEYPDFEAALALLPALPPDTVHALLVERAERLDVELAQAHAAREIAEKRQVPRLQRIEREFHTALVEAELGFVRTLADDIGTGALEGLDWWRGMHDEAAAASSARTGGTGENR